MVASSYMHLKVPKTHTVYRRAHMFVNVAHTEKTCMHMHAYTPSCIYTPCAETLQGIKSIVYTASKYAWVYIYNGC